MRPSVDLLAIALTALALTASQVSAQTLGEVTAATGIHSTLQGNAVGSSTRALDTVNRSLAKSTKPRDYDFDSPSGAKAGSRPAARSKKIRPAQRDDGAQPRELGHRLTREQGQLVDGLGQGRRGLGHAR